MTEAFLNLLIMKLRQLLYPYNRLKSLTFFNHNLIVVLCKQLQHSEIILLCQVVAFGCDGKKKNHPTTPPIGEGWCCSVSVSSNALLIFVDFCNLLTCSWRNHIVFGTLQKQQQMVCAEASQLAHFVLQV